MSRNRRTTKTSKKLDLRSAYNMGGYSGDYAWFVRTKVIPVIGEAALHPIASKSGSRVREYNVTQRNLHRVIKALGVDTPRYNQLQAVKTAVRKAGVDATAEMIIKLVESTEQPEATDKFPLRLRIPLHPISNNMLYEAKGNRMVKTVRYTEWRKRFFQLINAIEVDEDHGIDFTKPMEVIYKFGHRESSRSGGSFDRPNFQKAAQDCVFEYFGHDDNKVHDSSVRGEFVPDYPDGYMEYSVRNL